MRRSRALAMHAAVSGFLGLTVTALWALTGGSFWPIWVWYGLAIPLALHGVLRLAARAPRGRWRPVAFHGALVGWVSATLLVTWAMAGSDELWPRIPVFCLAMLLGLHAVIVALRPDDHELTERVDELTRTRRGALDVQAHELRRIERDLHDGAQARLVALTMQLGRAEARLEEHPEAAELVREARGEASAAIAELRDLARGIAPPVLADRGLPAAVEALGARAPIRTTVSATVNRRPPPVVETAAYFVVAESLTNAAKHAGAGAVARVSVADLDGRLEIEVADDGAGGADAAGSGLTGLRHRVEALDGTLTVSPGADGGTTIRASFPL
ncbi:MAG TPA: histidine kinase [Solirubrobacteraceae bacterium]|nr:histidine kinase [Solirubrobacteraceae bacterium]